MEKLLAALPWNVDHRSDGGGQRGGTTPFTYQRGKMSADIAKIVEQIPHWEWQPSGHRRDDRIELLVEAYGVMGRSALLNDAKFKGVSIGTWVRSQRVSHANGTMPPEVTERLNDLSFWTWGNVKPYIRKKRK
jgi:hypothetical protein